MRKIYLLIRLKPIGTRFWSPAAGKLREVYPGMYSSSKKPVHVRFSGRGGKPGERLKRGELDMFRDFFQQVLGQASRCSKSRRSRRSLQN